MSRRILADAALFAAHARPSFAASFSVWGLRVEILCHELEADSVSAPSGAGPVPSWKSLMRPRALLLAIMLRAPHGGFPDDMATDYSTLPSRARVRNLDPASGPLGGCGSEQPSGARSGADEWAGTARAASATYGHIWTDQCVRTAGAQPPGCVLCRAGDFPSRRAARATPVPRLAPLTIRATRTARAYPPGAGHNAAPCIP
ncbi:hypothetical protein WOLCODRAFT_156923 [Wolfiporia cocos MD-104 SS10]|uniref:Uncharacterized protein n=1 Tax=Wolfiporia cocos (strain MD-104) TaxID=742152 RepID=A0A2H3J1S6_WOLCO|nr:hypothetical protein WOLCODRAFT_156923 [Wolfiporia cocos MD-104 SS10]